eukprot:CAMPEP_0118654536 /NCGR_PEP_ID=MMETSP0785-20121206/12447_1 /TAXON_ID=91992 /ORGANISM="Bolidomonas pacifica, Strain CCMP 1866" /LENGTH=203 /DNA_ID=CAMNT_0006547213 /DNA_START=68 /DNA_END=680 /DNA_ORIENTATION=-
MTLSHVLVYTINLNHTARVRRPVTAVVGAVMLGHTGAKVAITRCFFALRPAFETLAPSHGRVVDDLAPIVAAHLLGFVAVNLFLAGPTFVDAAFFLALADISLGFMIPGTTTCIPDATRGSITPTTVASNIVVAMWQLPASQPVSQEPGMPHFMSPPPLLFQSQPEVQEHWSQSQLSQELGPQPGLQEPDSSVFSSSGGSQMQ